MHAALPLRFTWTLPRRCMQVFVVLLRFFGDDGKEKRLLPCGRLPRSIKPSVGRLPWTSQSGNNHSGGIRGERISEGHGQILPQKKKYAMQKINLAKCPQCRQHTRMSNTTTNQMTRGTEVRSSEWFGVRYYVGTAPYGRDFIVPQETFEETCKWFDGMEKQNWNAW